VDLSVRAPLAATPEIPHPVRFSWAFVVSAFLHLALAWRLAIGTWAPDVRGEDGDLGAGGATFEVTVAGPEAEVPAPIPSVPSTAPVAEASEDAARVGRPTIRVLPRTRDGTEASAPIAASAAQDETTAPNVPVVPAGTGDRSTDSGRMSGADDARIRALLAGSVGGGIGGSALGDVTLLTAVSRCPDPIAGTWTAHRYSPEFRDWARFTLSIRRDGDELTGTIRTRMWRGLPSDTRPPACTAFGWDYTVEMRAHGNVHGDTFDFGAQEHHIAHVECASPTFGYNPDHFSGSWDVERDQLRTLNNDGGRDVDAAYTFRRSSCQP
jgi:hypothetical protein